MGFRTTNDVISNCPPWVQDAQYQLLLTLAHLVPDDTREWWIHEPKLAEAAHMHRSTVIRAMKKLLAWRLVYRERKSRKEPYTYVILDFNKHDAMPVQSSAHTFAGEMAFTPEERAELEQRGPDGKNYGDWLDEKQAELDADILCDGCRIEPKHQDYYFCLNCLSELPMAKCDLPDARYTRASSSRNGEL